MNLHRWDYQAQAYESYQIPDSWNVSSYSDDMGELINCASCGKQITFGEGYTSLEIHQPITGFGYTVCPTCHQSEIERQYEARN